MATVTIPRAGEAQRRPEVRKIGRFYAPELDALRFAAFMLVFMRHVSNALGAVRQAPVSLGLQPGAERAAVNVAAAPMSPLWGTLQGIAQSFDFGVCLFFFLSSFLITRLLLIERASTGTVSVRDFYIRRCLRIWPLYFSFLALIAVVSGFVPILHVSIARLVAAVFFVSNWAAVLHGWASIPIQPLWSVSIEEQFYLVWPQCARWGKQSIILFSLTLALVSLSTLLYLGHGADTQVTEVWPNTLVQCLFLAGGAITACLSSPETRRLPIHIRLTLIMFGFLSWGLAAVRFHVVRTHSPGSRDLIVGYLIVLLGTFLIFSGVAGWSAGPIPRWLVYLGKISYGLYVFHVACLLVIEHLTLSVLSHLNALRLSPYAAVCISALLALAATFGCASLSYRYLEMRFLKLKDRFTAVLSRPA
jgi:peptidoglycan/LPS O-acetylase OafA/YrhL